jgi:hypothetical protein
MLEHKLLPTNKHRTTGSGSNPLTGGGEVFTKLGEPNPPPLLPPLKQRPVPARMEAVLMKGGC